MSYLIKLAHNQSQFSVNEQKLAQFILHHSLLVKTLSSSALAQQAEVSQSSVIKFVQKLGLKGFSDFKIALSEELAREQHLDLIELKNKELTHLHNGITSDDTLEQIAEKLVQEKQQALIETTRAIDFNCLTQVIDKIIAAKRVQIIGIGGSALIAKDLAYKLLKIGISVLTEIDTHVQLSIVPTLTSQDLLIAISYSGSRREINKAVDEAKRKGVTVIAITSVVENTLHQNADYLLFSIADESRWRSSSISSRTAQNTITDLLFMGIIQRNIDQAERLIKDSRDIVNSLSQ